MTNVEFEEFDIESCNSSNNDEKVDITATLTEEEDLRRKARRSRRSRFLFFLDKTGLSVCLKKYGGHEFLLEQAPSFAAGS